MGRKRAQGLRFKNGVWNVEKTICGQRIYRSTGTSDLGEAERFLHKLIAEIEAQEGRGESLTFDQAAGRYLMEYQHKRSIWRDAESLKRVMPYIKELNVDQVHSGTLNQFVSDRRKAGLAAATVNRDLAIVRRILVLSARKWRNHQGQPYLATVPLLSMVSGESREPRPITWPEQTALLQAMPGYLAEMCLFMLNTGLRDQELCGLKWTDEFPVKELGTTVFIITKARAKGKFERIVPLNAVARSIVDQRRGQGEYVFEFEGHRLQRMNNKAWRKARESCGLQRVRVHDLRHSFGMRLRAAGVGFEDRQDLLGHYARSITTHYSRAEISRLIDCVELLCQEGKKPELTIIRSA